MRHTLTIVCLLVLVNILRADNLRPTGHVFYVSPSGKAGTEATPDKPLDLATALSTNSPVKPGDTILLMPGVYEGDMKDIERMPFVATLSGTKVKPILIMAAPGLKAHLNGTIEINGSYLWFVNLEIGDLQWDLDGKSHKNGPVVKMGNSYGDRIINCNCFGGWDGILMLSAPKNMEVYGTLVHDFGCPEGKNAYSGSAFYTHNEFGRKTIAHCICYRTGGLGLGLHVYNGKIVDYEIRENIFYLAGGVVTNVNHDNIYINGGSPADKIQVIGNVAYQPCSSAAWRPNARMSMKNKPPGIVNRSGVFQGNYLVGANFGLSLGPWEDLHVTDNTIWAEKVLVEINSSPTGCGIKPQETKPDLGKFKLENNTYYLPKNEKAFRYANHEALEESDLIGFADWQALGLDKTSRIANGKNGRPVGTKTFVFPNKYQEGRGQVAVFNWDGLDSVRVDLSKVLAKGARFQIYNCLDIRQTIDQAKPVLAGMYDGAEIALPMRRDSSSPDFDAFLVLPRP